jgi:ribosomal protection tetracycline resistance protein
MHVERPRGTGEGHDASSMGNASEGLRVEPGPVGSGVTYVMAIERGYLLPSFHVAIEETLPNVVREGLRGWQVTDCVVTLVHGRFSAPTPSAGEYRRMTQTTFDEALRNAGTIVCAPYSRFELELPVDMLTAVLAKLTTAGATPDPPELGTTRCRVTGRIPTEVIDAFEQRLPGMTSGRGVFFSEPDGYEPVRGAPPTRLRV